MHWLPVCIAWPASALSPGSIDFPMPWKTHGRCCRVSLRRAGGFELLRGLVSQCGVEPQPIVVVLDELFEMGVQFIDVLILIGIDLFPLEGLDEALAEGIVVRVSGTAHAGQDAVDIASSAVYCSEAY